MDTNVKLMSEMEIANVALSFGWVKFSYYKADGTKRIAIGTRNHEILNAILGERNNEEKSNRYFKNCNSYFDLTRCNWRSFSPSRFIGLELERLTTEQAVHEAVLISLTEEPCEETIDLITETTKKLNCGKVIADSEREWCIRYNGGRGLNGVLLSAASNGGSGCLGWPSAPISNTNTTNIVSELKSEMTNGYRKSLIKELMDIRKRESEILAELFS